MKRIVIPILAFLVFVGCSEEQKMFDLEHGAVTLPVRTKINQIQVLGTHNSYAKPIDPQVVGMLDPVFTGMKEKYFNAMSPEKKALFKENHPNDISWSEGLSYDHPDFETQLDAGLRSLELDVYYDPTGRRFDKPAAYEALKQKGVVDLLPYDSIGLKEPGFKLFHVADIDFRSHYTSLKEALTVLRTWSESHPDHTPIFIMVEAKDTGYPILPNASEVLPFTPKVYDQLDAEVLQILGRDKVIVPDDIRGDYQTLEAAVLAQNWPTLESSLGKFVFLLLPGAAGIADEDAYVEGHPNLEGRAMFVKSGMGRPHAAFLLLDNSLVRKEAIQQAVKQGYLVRTRADIETYEAKVNDPTRANTAMESGAQVISTDFFSPGNVYGTDYYVQLPNGLPVRENPVNTTMPD